MPTIVSSPLRSGCVNRLGWRIEGRTLSRTIRDKHQLHTPPALAYDAAEYDRLRPDIDDLRVDNAESGGRFTISAAAFANCREFLDRGYGPQWFVRLEHWTQEPLPGHQLALDLAPQEHRQSAA